MDEHIDKHNKFMEEFIEKSIKNGIIDYCKKNNWIKYDGKNFIIIDENIKKKINKNEFSKAIEVLDVIKLYLKENNNSKEFEENWDDLSNDALGE